MATWQVSAGDSGRDYSEVFLRFGVMAAGPGTPGPYDAVNPVYNDRGSWAHRPWMYDFCDGVQPDDLVILKRPYSKAYWKIVAVGTVTGGYEWNDAFGDVDGWDLQHIHRVEWRMPSGDNQVRSGYVRRTLARVGSAEVEAQARELWDTGTPRPAEEIPSPADEVDIDALIDALMEEGLPASRAEEVVSTMKRITRLAQWYDQHSADVGEHEIRTFLIVPLLLALGWPEQCIKIEFRHVDVALFDRPYTGSTPPTTVLESKRLYEGLGAHVAAQAAGYAASFEGCDRLVVSDGFRYRLAERNGSDDGFHDVAYANLLRLRDRDPINDLGGARELFLALLPGRR